MPRSGATMLWQIVEDAKARGGESAMAACVAALEARKPTLQECKAISD